MLTDARVQRYVNLGWPGRQPVAPSWADAAHAALKRGFPEIAASIELVPVCSRRRYWDVLESENGKRVIIADLKYTETLAEIDALSFVGNPSPILLEVFATAVTAWALYSAGEYEKSVVLCAQLRQVADKLTLFRKAAYQSPQAEAIELFVLFHEAAHALVDDPAVDLGELRDTVDGALDKFVRTQELFVADLVWGQSRPGWAFAGYVPEAGEDLAHMEWQLDKFRTLTDHNAELRRELYCDFVALTRTVSFYFGDVLNSSAPMDDAQEAKRLADVLIISIRAARAMQTLSAIRSEAAMLRDGAKVGDYTGFFAEQTMRQNINVNLAAWLLEFAGGNRLTLPNTRGEHLLISDLFLRSVKSCFERSTERILAKTSDVTELLRTPETYQQAKAEVWLAEADRWHDLVGANAEMLDQVYG